MATAKKTATRDSTFPGYGGKRPLLYVYVEKLYLDPKNPRLSSEHQNKEQTEIQRILKRDYYLDELAVSMANNGYFDEEPLVAIPKKLPKEFEDKGYDELKNDKNYENFLNDENTEYIVVEGNRRLCTVKILLSGEKGFPLIDEDVRADLQKLPIIIYPQRKEVISYLGARHIIGVRKWESYAKAQYIANLREEHKLSLSEIQDSVGDTSDSAKHAYLCYKLVEKMEEEFRSYDTKKAKENFSLLMLAFGNGVFKDFLGIPTSKKQNIDFDNLVPSSKIENLHFLFSWIFGEGREKDKVIGESRDISKKLAPVLRSPVAIEYLKEYRNLDDAYERCGGEEELLLRKLRKIKRDMGESLVLVGKYNNSEVKELIEDIKILTNQLLKSTE